MKKMNWLIAAIFLEAQVSKADAQSMGLTDPRLCYILDGILFIYGIVITALYLKNKLSAPREVPVDDTYAGLKQQNRVEYDELRLNRDAEKGGQKQRRKRNDALYTSLRKDQPADQYSEIALQNQKGEQRRRGRGEGIYQGLSAATKDTYDSLQMQPLPPRSHT
ncbi:T-cell surface glycoprotein CD3 zeta chain [Latimeria chalumnae]|uniref:T-cell surface glycoprotein CD3 zeta chain n=1 Tax=Latimeria menadoensis TaxID=106881 RepID=X2D2D6_LATME|nr:PREDICTED: T-cell surface glycoprotein CD3 zeta chain [Latimeria chalumnae]AHG59321.1 CD3 zeta [Latimeria menadoensis]|eukprot:XP_014352588.1 PREDICTED: T-cell surface glycoprotein CD3 zeta chain [Latimeria chalumnae]